MKLNAILLTAALLGAVRPVMAQSDSLDHGGPEGLDIYEELLMEDGGSIDPVVPRIAITPLVWDVNDSLSYIP
ncbi:MAG: hypothetical protein ACK6A5_08030, partial [Flavobacteriales bacterium]